ncbi:MAG: type IV pilus modification PilV family protein [Bdellovibrionota bacterium]
MRNRAGVKLRSSAHVKLRSSAEGFTLLEVMIAFALLAVILSAVFITQGTSSASSSRAKNVLIATNLAHNFIVQQEVKYDGVPLDQLPKEESGTFDDPNQNYKWSVKYEEVDFNTLADMLAKKSEGEQQDQNTGTVIKLFLDYLKKSVRRMTVTIEWADGKGNSNQTFSQLMVNYDAEFSTGL